MRGKSREESLSAKQCVTSSSRRLPPAISFTFSREDSIPAMSSADVTPEILAKYTFLVNTPGYTRFKLVNDPAEVVHLHSQSCLWLGIPTVWEENGFVYQLPPPEFAPPPTYEDVHRWQSHDPQRYRHRPRYESRPSYPTVASAPQDSADIGYRIRGTAKREVIDLTDSPPGQNYSHHDIFAAHDLRQTAPVQASHKPPVRQTKTLAERINFPTGHPDAWIRSLVRKADERIELNTHVDNYTSPVPNTRRGKYKNRHIRSTRVNNRGRIQKSTRYRPHIRPGKKVAFSGRRMGWDTYLPDYRTYGGPARHRTPPHRLERIWIPRTDCYRPDYTRNPWMGRRDYPRTNVHETQYRFA
jgi:hypothetical protein